MKKLLQKLSISLTFILILLLFISPNVFATEGEEGEIEDTTPPIEDTTGNEEVIPDEPEVDGIDTPIEEPNTPNDEKPPLEEENPPIDEENSPIEEEQPTEEKDKFWDQIASFFKNIKQFFEDIGFEQWLEEEFLPALPQSIWSLILSLLVFLTTYKKNKQGATDIQTSIISMGLAKTSMDATNSKLEDLIKNEVANAVAKIAMIAKEVDATNLDMKQYKADLKAEIDQIKQIEKAMKEILVTAFTNTAELVANGQAETIAKVATKYEQEKQKQETA